VPTPASTTAPRPTRVEVRSVMATSVRRAS
jgi:hypothetical protein